MRSLFAALCLPYGVRKTRTGNRPLRDGRYMSARKATPSRIGISASRSTWTRLVVAQPAMAARPSEMIAAVDKARSLIFGIRVQLDDLVQEPSPVHERLDAHALVEAVDVVSLGVLEEARQAIGRDAGRIEILSVGVAREHRRDDGDARPDGLGHPARRPHDGFRQRRHRRLHAALALRR